MLARINTFIKILALIALVSAITAAPAFCAGITAKDGPVETTALEKQDAGPGKDLSDRSIVIYYFHTTNRCYSCTRLEKMTYLAVAEEFEQELGDGRVKFASVNVEQDENKHFIKDYRLFTKSVIVSDVVRGKEQRWKNLQRVWELLGDDEVFKDYVLQEIRLYLGGQ